MSYGRKDYFWGVAPEKSVFGELQTSFQKWEAKSLAYAVDTDFISYTVSLGYILNITGIVLSSQKPGMSQFSLKEDAVSHGSGYFDTSLSIVFGQGGELVIEPGAVFKVILTNLSSYTMTYNVFVYGYFQQTIV